MLRSLRIKFPLTKRFAHLEKKASNSGHGAHPTHTGEKPPPINMQSQAKISSSFSFSFDKLILLMVVSCGVITIGDAWQEGTENLKDSKLSSSAKHKYIYKDTNIAPQGNKEMQTQGGQGQVPARQIPVEHGQGRHGCFTFTATHIRDLERNGYVIINNVLSMKEVKDARTDISNTFGAILESDIPPHPLSINQLEYRTDNFVLMDKSYRDEVVARRKNPLLREPMPVPVSIPASNTQLTGAGADSGEKEEEGNGEALLHVQLLLRSLGGALQDAGFRGFHEQSERGITSIEKDSMVAKLSIPRFLQLSHYSPSIGAFYTAHKDAPPRFQMWNIEESSTSNTNFMNILARLRQYSYSKRYITAILYLNNTSETGGYTHWNANIDGGQLRLYPDAKTEKEIEIEARLTDPENKNDKKGTGEGEGIDTAKGISINVDPSGGTLVIFDSHELLHEVMPTNRHRYALTCWFTA